MKTVLITGANRGIGLEHARSFAAKGWQVFATARTPAVADELNALAKSHAGRFKVFAYDAADPEAPVALKSSLGGNPIDVLLANAGALFGAALLPKAIERLEQLRQLFRRQTNAGILDAKETLHNSSKNVLTKSHLLL